MNLLKREPVRIGRAARKERDDRVFLVATEDTYAAKQYLDYVAFAIPRVYVRVLPTPEGSGLSSPRQVVDRLQEAFADARSRSEVVEGDEFWVVLDTDHYIQKGHCAQTIEAVTSAEQFGFHIAFSNPSFELWLLLHHVGLGREAELPDSASVVAKLRETLGSYRKDAIRPERFGPTLLPAAIGRARALEENPDHPKGYWPEKIGTRVYRLMEAIGFAEARSP